MRGAYDVVDRNDEVDQAVPDALESTPPTVRRPGGPSRPVPPLPEVLLAWPTRTG